jgi:hypothetical protein
MIYKREDYIEENPQDSKFPVRNVEVLTATDGSATKYYGQLTLGIQTPVGVQQIPIAFEIEASSVDEAFQKFDASAEPKIEEARKSIEQEISRLRQEASSRIVRPGEVGMGGAAGPGNVIDMKKFK